MVNFVSLSIESSRQAESPALRADPQTRMCNEFKVSKQLQLPFDYSKFRMCSSAKPLQTDEHVSQSVLIGRRIRVEHTETNNTKIYFFYRKM